jgi:hypothetical protein
MSVKDSSAYRSIRGVGFQVSGFSLTPAPTPETRNDSTVILIGVANTTFSLNGSPKGLFHF